MSHDVENKSMPPHETENDSVYEEKAAVADYKADAIEAENAEHNMTVLQAVKEYPMATFWAFVMSFTIVRHVPAPPLTYRTQLTVLDYVSDSRGGEACRPPSEIFRPPPHPLPPSNPPPAAPCGLRSSKPRIRTRLTH